MLEEYLEDCFIVDGADELGSHCFIQGISNGTEVTCCCTLSDSGCQFLNSFTWFLFQVRPEFEYFPYHKTLGMKLLLHKSCNFSECQFIDFLRNRELLCHVTDVFVYCIHLCPFIILNRVRSSKSLEYGSVVLP